MRDLLFVLDQGSSQHKLVVFDRSGAIVDSLMAAGPELIQHDDGLGFDGHALLKISNSLISRALARFPQRFAGFGLANQGESVLAWDRLTGQPLSKVVSWQCQGAASFLAARAGHFDLIRSRTGLIPSAYFSAAKLGRIVQRNLAVQAMADAGRLALGTLDAWMIYNWTADHLFLTDPTTACRTQLFDIHHGAWSSELLLLFGLKPHTLPEVLTNSDFEVACDVGPFAAQPLPLLASLCDQPAGLIGHGGLGSPTLKVCLGTGAFVDLSLPAGGGVAGSASQWAPPALDPPPAFAIASAVKPAQVAAGPSAAALVTHAVSSNGVPAGLLKSVLFAPSGEAMRYYWEGGVLSFGSAEEWLIQNLRVTLEEAIANLTQDTGLLVLPAFVGLGAPHFSGTQKSIFWGVDLTTPALDLATATLQGLIFRIAEIIDTMAAHAALPATVVIDGGLSRSSRLMQFLADALGRPVIPSDTAEVTSRGVAQLVRRRLFDHHFPAPPDAHPRRHEPGRAQVRTMYQKWQGWVQEMVRYRRGT